MSYPGEDRREPIGEGNHVGNASRSAHSEKNGGFKQPDELDLGDDDVRLPWLEGDDDEDLVQGGVGSGQLIGFVVLGIALLALIIGGIWWFQREQPDEALVADGETIAAPAEPYKTKPKNPGGEVVAGTGDTSFAVAEGQTRQVRIGNGDVAGPAQTTAPAVAASATPAASASSSAASASTTDMSGVGVQIGAYSNRESADKGWTTLTQQHEVLSGMRYRIVEGRADIGTVYRLQAVPSDLAAANRLCATLKGAGLNCQVKH